MHSDITLVIPTYNNRHLYVRRILDYYREVNAPFRILVIDSSPTAFKEATNYPAVHYMHHPDDTYAAKLSRAMRMVATPFVVLCADDDFITLDGIQACTEFLMAHPDYASVQGHLVAFAVPGKV